MSIRPTKEALTEFHVNYNQDSDFSAYARLLQSKWREKMGYPYNENKYGNFLPPDFARKYKCNFLTDKIRLLVEYELLRKANFGKLIREDRMWENLLSSQPLCFNLFGELHFDLKLATRYFKKLFPGKIDNVDEILFEHSPGRGNKKFTGDRSAFDVFVEYSKKDKKGFIGIEVKYTESLKEEDAKSAKASFVKHEDKYTELTTTDIFVEGAIEELKKAPLSQIWRDHLLSISTKQIYDEGFFVFLFPSKNSQCEDGVKLYKQYLVSENEEITGFYPRYLDDFINSLNDFYKTEWSNELQKRYLG